MSAGALAALIAAAFFAVGVCAAVYVLFRLARLISLASTVLTGYQDATDGLLRRAQATVDRADAQLGRTQALSESVEAVTASMTDLSEQVSAVAGSARLIANGLGTPVLRIAAAGHGVRRALAIRRAGPARELPGRTRVRP
jgi:uncharacterized protein YoxC